MSGLLNRYPPLFERLFRALGIRGPLPDSLTWEAQLGVNLLDLSRPEYSWLWREQRYVYGHTVSPVAAQNSVSIIGLPSTASALLVIDKIRIWNANAGTQSFGLLTDSASAGAAVNRVCGLDTRADLSTTAVARPQSQVFAHNAALGFPGGAARFQLAANTELVLNSEATPWVLRPGTFLWLQDENVNLSLNVQYFVRERQPSDSELS